MITANDDNFAEQNGLYWKEDDDAAVSPATSDVTDLAFTITCRSLPLDHAWALSQAIRRALPWWFSDPLAGLHLIHGAESGNGWHRNDAGDGLLYLTRRTRLVLRLPRARVADAQAALQGCTLDVAGFPLTVGEAAERPLRHHPALYARHIVSDPADEEKVFLAAAVRELQLMAVQFKKMLAGKLSVLATPEGPCTTRSLMVADLTPEAALELQRRGLGVQRTLGCGVFVPCKTIGVK